MEQTVNKDLDERARAILRANDKGGFTVPTSGLYPYQWNWDSVFVALGFATFDESRAIAEIETLFEAQWDDGMVPHIIFRRDDPDYFPGPSVWQSGTRLPTSGITQPPVAASVIYALWKTASADESRGRLAALFPKLMAWHRWFHQYRVPEGINAVVITHPWESGRDNSPEWDEPLSSVDVSGVKPYTRRDLQHAESGMRPTKLDYDRYLALLYFGRDTGWNHATIAASGPFRVADVCMTFVLLRATRDLQAFAKALGDEGAARELAGYAQQLEGGVDYLWDNDARTFCSRNTITGAFSGHVTNGSFLYAYAGAGSAAQQDAMAMQWERLGKAARYLMPSHDPGEAKFDDMRYWRGPVWLMMNYMMAQGFAENGAPEWANRLRADARALIEKSGFWESFGPVSGNGTGGRDFSWTAAMWLAWCGRSLEGATQ